MNLQNEHDALRHLPQRDRFVANFQRPVALATVDGWNPEEMFSAPADAPERQAARVFR